MRLSISAVSALILFFCCFSLPARAADGLAVLQMLPEDEVERLTQIVIRFSEPMRPLGVAGESAQDAPARLEALEGRVPSGSWLWLDPSTLAYLMDAPVDEPVRLRVTMPKGLKALSGARLNKETSFTVSTPPLALRTELWNNSTGLLPPKDGNITLISNYRLDPQSIRASLASPSGPVELGPVTEPEWQKKQEEHSFSGSWSYELPVTGTVPPDSRLTLRLEPGFTTATGLNLHRGFVASLQSYRTLSLVRLQPDPERQGKVSPFFSLSLELSNPVPRSEVLRNLSLEPPAPLQHESSLENNYASRYFHFNYKLEPGVTYTLTLKKGLTDEYGTALKQDVVRKYTAGDYPPFFSMKTGDIVLEKALGGRLRLEALNTDQTALDLRFIPWDKGGFAAYGPAECDAKTLEKLDGLPGTIKKRLELDYSGKRNQIVSHSLDPAAELGLDSLPGFVVVTAEVPQGAKEKPALVCARAQVTGIGLTMKRGWSNSLAFATDLASGKPLPGAALSLVAASGEVLWQGTSDDAGLAFAPGLAELPAETRLFLVADKNGDSAVLPVREDGQRWNQTDIHSPGFSDSDSSPLFAAHALTQLPLYEPGQTVNYALFLRRHLSGASLPENRIPSGDAAKANEPSPDAGAFPDRAPLDAWLPEAGRELAVEVRDSRGKILQYSELQSNGYGSVSGELALAENAPLGSYDIRVRPDKKAGWISAGSFTVASFRPPEFRVEVDAPDSRVRTAEMADTLTAAVRADYFSGARLPNGAVFLALAPSESSFRPERLAGYTVGLGNPYPFFHPLPKREITPPPPLEGRLDENGLADFTLPPLAAKPGLPLDVALEATVTDGSGLTSQGTASFTLHPSEHYIGIRGPRFATAKAPFELDLKAATRTDAPLSDIAVTLRAERRVPRKDPAYDNEESYEVVWSKEVTLTRAEGERFAVSLDQGGLYRLYAEISDEAGRSNASRLTVYVPGSGTAWFGPRDAGGLELAADAEAYKPGDTARIVVRNPYDRATALVTTERDGVRLARVLELEGSAPEITLPLSLEDAPYVYASVTLIRGRVSPETEAGQDLTNESDPGRPRVSHAVLRLKVEQPSPELAVSLETDSGKYRPGETVTATVRTALRAPDGEKQPQRTQVTLLAVDERILRAAGERTNYDPSPSFAPLYPHRVATADLRMLLNGLSRFYSDNFYLSRSLSRMVMAAPAAGAMEAQDSAAPERKQSAPGNKPPREDFGPLAFWLAGGETDEHGKLSASFVLPDTLTGYRVVAVAADKEGRFAKTEGSFTVSKPLQALSALPRFLVAGDRLEARFLIQNLGNRDGTAVVELEVQGAEAENTRLEVPVKAGKDAVAAFPVRPHVPAAGASGRATLIVSAALGQERDAASYTLPVLPAAPLEAVAASGMLKAGESFTLPVSLPERLDLRSALEVSLAASPAAGMAPAFRQLLDYPYECLEQRFSRAWARAIRLEHGELLGFSPEQDDREKIAATLKSAAEFQNEDGGFGLWPGFSRSDPYLTAYVLLAADHMRPLGLTLDENVEEAACTYLEQTLQRYAKATGKAKAGEELPVLAPEQASLALWALSRRDEHKQAAADLFAPVYDRAMAGAAQKGGEAPMLWCALIQALCELPQKPGMPVREDALARLVARLEKTAQVTPTHLHFSSPGYASYWTTMGSTLRDNGMALAALTLARPDYPRLDALASWLSRGLGEKEVLSTQEAIFGFRGLALYLEHLKQAGGGGQAAEQTGIDALWNGAETMQARFTRLVDPPALWTLPLARGGQSELTLAAQQGAPCWTARLRWAPAEGKARAVNAGFTLKRESGSGSWRTGEEVTVKLTLYVPATRRHVLLFDPFPAGLEPLYASRADLAAQNLERQPPWLYQDLLADGLLLYAPLVQPGIHTFTYKLRAAFPGEFIHRPARVEEMYTPEVYGRSEGGKSTVRE